MSGESAASSLGERAGGGVPGMGMPGMPSNPAEMERMLEQISPEQMAKQAEMLEQRSRQRRCRLGSATARLGSATLASQLGSPGPWLR